jgi:hypothetical protein
MTSVIAAILKGPPSDHEQLVLGYWLRVHSLHSLQHFAYLCIYDCNISPFAEDIYKQTAASLSAVQCLVEVFTSPSPITDRVGQVSVRLAIT